MKVKDLGQVFTPINIVKDVLDAAGYSGEIILNKHVIDNSCGDGAFLVEIINRYIDAYYKKYNTLTNISKDLKKYIHGIEIDKEIYDMCIKNLNNLLDSRNIEKVKLDILNKDALGVIKYNHKMDFVLGNPPYVRVHNLNSQYENVKKYSFCNTGMTDLYIVFYEIGLKMLNEKGVLCYITPNSFYNSLAGRKLREYLENKKNLELIMDLGHYQPFSVTTYTTICKIVNNQTFLGCKYYKYNTKTGTKEFIDLIEYKNLFVNNNIVLDNDLKYIKILNYELKKDLKVVVKNGFATLNDKVFIQDEFPFKENQIEVIKGSTNEIKKCIYPYDKEGKLIPFEKLDKNVQEYLENHKKDLIKENSKKDSVWYAFGRSQGINDVKLNKISINTTIKDLKSIKLNKVPANKGVYSSLYLLTDISFEKIKSLIYRDDFIEYLKILNKCKSGGYFTLSSKDLAKYLNYYLEEENE